MQHHPQRGFSLLELMVAVTILAIMLGLAVPSFREFTRNNRAIAAQNNLATALNLARSEALRRARPVSLCASTDGESCGGVGDWTSGWIVFADPTTPGVVDDPDAEIVQRYGGPEGDVTITATAPFVQYAATGMSAADLQLDLAWTGCTGMKKRRMQVIASGALVSQKVNCP